MAKKFHEVRRHFPMFKVVAMFKLIVTSGHWLMKIHAKSIKSSRYGHETYVYFILGPFS